MRREKFVVPMWWVVGTCTVMTCMAGLLLVLLLFWWALAW